MNGISLGKNIRLNLEMGGVILLYLDSGLKKNKTKETAKERV